MLVTNIEISQYQYCDQSNRQSANVCMTLGDRFVTLFCRIPVPEGETAGTRAGAFVREAIRQIKRMPEFRSGRSDLTFAEHLAEISSHPA